MRSKQQKTTVSDVCTRALDALPDVFVAAGTATAPPQLDVTSVDDLVSRAKKSFVGKGSETVYDERVRKSLELVPGEGCRVEWPQLGEVLQRVSRDLVQGRTLRAEPYKILVYREGDFFRWHRDSKKGEGHLLTLCVDTGLDECEGGELLFRHNWEDDSLEGDRTEFPFAALVGQGFGSNRCKWSSNGRAGAYACWFATQMHSVDAVTSGRRVVVQYNVFLDQADRLAVPRLDLRPWPSENICDRHIR